MTTRPSCSMQIVPRASSLMAMRWLALAILGGAWLGAADTGSGDRTVSDWSGSGWKVWFDAKAAWKDDDIFAPPVDLAKVPVNPPTGGWAQLNGAPGAVPCAVPGTVEEYLGDGNGPDSVKNLQGVSWFWREVDVPADIGARRVSLEFDAVRLRAEVFMDDKLVGYDVVGMTPFGCDLTGKISAGHHRLAVRVTNPGGRYDWIDFSKCAWGKHLIPLGRAFGGFAGGVRLVVRDAVSLDDVWVRNAPEPRTATIIATVANPGAAPVVRTIRAVVTPKEGGATVAEAIQRNVTIPPGGVTVELPITAPNAAMWELDHPHLHIAQVSVEDGDRCSDVVNQTFGYRWFSQKASARTPRSGSTASASWCVRRSPGASGRSPVCTPPMPWPNARCGWPRRWASTC